MVHVTCIAPTRIGGSDAQGMRSGSWLFFTGHSATDFAQGLAEEVAGPPGPQLRSPPRYRWEGDFLMARLRHVGLCAAAPEYVTHPAHAPVVLPLRVRQS